MYEIIEEANGDAVKLNTYRIAMKFIADNRYFLDEIAENTGLTIDEVNKLNNIVEVRKRLRSGLSAQSGYYELCEIMRESNMEAVKQAAYRFALRIIKMKKFSCEEIAEITELTPDDVRQLGGLLEDERAEVEDDLDEWSKITKKN